MDSQNIKVWNPAGLASTRPSSLYQMKKQFLTGLQTLRVAMTQGSVQREQTELPIPQSFPERGLFVYFKSYCLSDWLITEHTLTES